MEEGDKAAAEAEIEAMVGASASAAAVAPAADAAADYPPLGLEKNIKKLEGWIQAGCGDKPYHCPEKGAVFPSDTTPDVLPDISSHNNCMTDFFKANPEMYAKLKDKKTSGGVNLAQCIKTGIDNPGHPMIKTVGLTAGDEESYVTFAELFDPVISDRHNGYGVDGTQPTDMDISKISDVDIDPFNKYVLTTRVRTGRSVRGFKLPPVISFEERRKLEAVCVKALLNMKDDLKGDYFPLHGSRSYPPKPNGMSEEDEEKLRSQGNLFQEPDSTLLLASGMGRHWPDGRGIFCNDNRNLFVWVGEEDHLRIVSMQGDRSKGTEEGKKIKEVFGRFIRACDEVKKVLKAEGSDFMHNDHLGWVLTCPSNLGTGLRAGTMVMLPKMSAREDWKTLLGTMGLQARGTGGVDSASTGGTWDISNADRVGKGEVDLVNILIEGAAQLVKWETALDAGNADAVEAEIKAKMGGEAAAAAPAAAADAGAYPPTGLSANVQKLPGWIQAGCGDAPYNCPEKEATWAVDGATPATMPDLAKHSNFMAEFLVANPDVYDRLKDKKTAGGVTLAQCMKTGVDNPGHPHIKTVGLVACDEESYDTFKELFDPVISARHNGYAPDAVQPTNMNMDQLSDTDIDPEGKYVLTTRVRTGRSVRGFQLPPTITFDERRKLEALCVKGLMSMEGDLKGDYFPLHGSKSYADKPDGMPESKEEELRAMGNLFQEPDSTLLLASGMGRHWPDGRGVFHNDAKNLFVWVGEEDHLRIVSMQGDRSKPTPEGKQIKEVTARFMRACDEVQKVLKQAGSTFMHNNHH